MTKSRSQSATEELTATQWKIFDDLFDAAYGAHKDDRLSYDKYKGWVIHIFSLARYEDPSELLVKLGAAYKALNIAHKESPPTQPLSRKSNRR